MEVKMGSPVAFLLMFLVFFSATRCRSLATPQELDRQIQELVEALSDQPSLWYNYNDDTGDYEPRILADRFSRNSRQERKQRRFVFPGLQDLFQRAKLASGGNPWRVTEMMYTNGKTGRK